MLAAPTLLSRRSFCAASLGLLAVPSQLLAAPAPSGRFIDLCAGRRPDGTPIFQRLSEAAGDVVKLDGHFVVPWGTPAHVQWVNADRRIVTADVRLGDPMSRDLIILGLVTLDFTWTLPLEIVCDLWWPYVTAGGPFTSSPPLLSAP